MLSVIFLAEFLPSWVCLHVTALKYLSIPCYFLLVQSQALKILLLSTVTCTQTHKKCGLCHITRTENSHNLLAQLSSHKRESVRNSLLLTPSTSPDPCCSSCPGTGEQEPIRHNTESMSQGEALDVPHTMETCTGKLLSLMGSSTLWELKTFCSQQTLTAVCAEEGIKPEQHSVSSTLSDLPKSLVKYLRSQ